MLAVFAGGTEETAPLLTIAGDSPEGTLHQWTKCLCGERQRQRGLLATSQRPDREHGAASPQQATVTKSVWLEEADDLSFFIDIHIHVRRSHPKSWHCPHSPEQWVNESGPHRNPRFSHPNGVPHRGTL